MLRKCFSPWCVIPLAIVAYPCVTILKQSFQVGGTTVGSGVLYQSMLDVLNGQHTGTQGRPLGGLDDLAVGVVHNAKVCLGQRYINPALKVCEGWDKLLGQEEEAEDAQFCKSLLGYMWTPPSAHGLTYPNIFADSADVAAWVDACKKEMPSMSAEERSLLAPWLKANGTSGGIPMEVLIPQPHDAAAAYEKSHAQSEKPIQNPPCERYSSSEIKELVMKSMAMSIIAHANITEPSSAVLKFWEAASLCKPHFIEATQDAVQKAVEEGAVASFDARAFLPEFLVNITPQDMAVLEGEEASRIPVWHDGARASSFQQFADEQAAYFQGDARYGSVYDLSMPAFFDGTLRLLMDPNLRNQSPWVDEFTSAQAKVEAALNMSGVMPFHAGYINARRLPQLYKKLPDITKRIGIDKDVLRTETLFWMGGTPGGLHYDEEQNFYVQLTGETFAFVVPPNFTDYFLGGERHPHEFPLHNKEVPIFLIHMKPGDGLVFPGRTYHHFFAQSPSRLSLNWFFVPKWRAMEYHEADWYHKEAKESLERLAVRQHWARTFSRLYDDTGKGVVFMGNKLEYI